MAVGAALLILIVVAVLIAPQKRQQALSWPLKAMTVLSSPEQALYFRLVQALPEYVVLAQVQLSRFLQLTVRQNGQAVRNRIDRKSADFLVCRRDFSVVVVVELDDRTHERADRRKADADKTAAVEAAGIKLVRWNVRSLPTVEQIRQELEPVCDR